MIDPEITAVHGQEVRRGSVVAACLLLLRTPGYGYGLLEALAAAGFAVEANTLYPLLRRLEKQGLLVSEWNTDETRPRKFYRTSETGRELATSLLREWAALGRSLEALDRGTTEPVTEGGAP
ncbi:PadR family transcriptional regulator [Rhodococcus zopfii]|uniref:PadR family transcriptional regulator n=1 Tax=Rhodococcus zopfii TaxID=43772 RepID=UPI0011115F24|nr:PadR family transcriptional regulator [Rhodococcus zopfii]